MIKMGAEVVPWQTPNFVRLKTTQRQDLWHETPTVPLAAVDADVLSDLCDQFRADVFLKAGKDDPKAGKVKEEQTA